MANDIESTMDGLKQVCLEHNLWPLILIVSTGPDEPDEGGVRVLTVGDDMELVKRVLTNLANQMESPAFSPKLIRTLDPEAGA